MALNLSFAILADFNILRRRILPGDDCEVTAVHLKRRWKTLRDETEVVVAQPEVHKFPQRYEGSE